MNLNGTQKRIWCKNNENQWISEVDLRKTKQQGIDSSRGETEERERRGEVCLVAWKKEEFCWIFFFFFKWWETWSPGVRVFFVFFYVLSFGSLFRCLCWERRREVGVNTNTFYMVHTPKTLFQIKIKHNKIRTL